MSDFLDEVNAHLEEGIRAFVADRAGNPELDDGEFVRQFGKELLRAIQVGLVSSDQVVYALVVAMNRLASQACACPSLGSVRAAGGMVSLPPETWPDDVGGFCGRCRMPKEPVQ